MLTVEDALAELSAECDATVWPSLDSADLERILDRHRIVDGVGNPPSNVDDAPDWTASTVVTWGTVVQVGERWWRCERPGTTAATEPIWPALDGVLIDVARHVQDGTVRWVDNGSRWAPRWHLAAAIAAGWKTKAAKCSGDHSFAEDGQNFDRNAVHRQCLRMADKWAGKAVLSVQLDV